MNLTLYSIPYSPWSLKARFALREKGVPVETRVYHPMIDELSLRVRLRRFNGRVTVPVLLTPDGALLDSWSIALYAERVGTGRSLIPDSARESILEWNAASERLMTAGRARSIVRASKDSDAIYETLPATVRNLPVLSGPIARSGLSLFMKKYAISREHFDRHETDMRVELDRLRAALSDGRKYLLEAFSYADVCLALALQLVKPLAESPMGRASRAAATDPELAASYADLLEWRDNLHSLHGLLPR